ncbi:16S rRNA (guanine(966)-N(2))-methyltransferase RsmD [Idiomarina sp. HP20-50]|uniref:16S rRNA (guanine(966)-N(2))-methyltransferase RsmD n=1 Tax=Idiomarina sp. HP20-50 TaxID=3070813 RepID=UPI00294AE5CF|nr:16S rRNA (guanine(966)-N(2))-methyltransferase RsmD [Idiomarina sp. HP20-50]MDV6316292.1 16S rRNA (guanine(966)-N(2))-methyltransferase RsmD [Idiomarina sp. HP20-50]
MRKKRQTSASGDYRIIGGRWRGRRLPVADSPGLRPTTDRVRETVFNWLQWDINGACVLDLFAGSGSLGFEAASRGATQVTLIEAVKAVSQQLQKNIELLNSPAINVVTQNALDWLQTESGKAYDVIFIDPPFREGLADKALQLLDEGNWLATDNTVYLETEKEWLLKLPPNWRVTKEKVHGQVCFRLLTKDIT